MALLRSLPENATLADLRRTYADLLEKLRPYGQRLMRGPSPLTPGQRELIAAFVSGVNSCRYCHGAHSTLYTNLSFNFIRDIAPVSGIMRVSYVIVVHPSVPATTVPEFIAYAKANPGKINMASAGSGTPQHIYGELFKMMAGVNLVHVPYRGEEACRGRDPE